MKLEPRKYFYYDPLTGEIIQANSFYSYNMANSSLKWENTESWNIGVDFTLLNGRLGGSIDVYTKKTNNLLNDRKLPDLIGYASVTSNIGEVNNKGVEISLRSTNIQRENFEWSTTFNLAYNKNTIKHLYGLMEDVLDEEGNVIGQKEADDISKGYFIGHALDEKWGYKFLGVWQENEAEEAAKYNQVPGDPKLLDVDQNYKYNNDDKVFLGNTTPKVRWNMRNEFTLFKNWNFSFSMYSYLGHVKTMDRFTNSNALLNGTGRPSANRGTSFRECICRSRGRPARG
jgi:outer membrane receptor protein involved in Fe transport